MTVDEMKALVRRLFDAHCRQDVEAAVACFTPDATNHGRPVGREGFAHTYRITPTTPPTGRRVAVMQAHFYRIEDGLIAEHRTVRDDFDLARQRGLLPGDDASVDGSTTDSTPRHAGFTPS